MGMILRIASSRIVGQGDIVGRSGYFSLNLSANSVMRGRLDARRTLKSLVADLRVEENGANQFEIKAAITVPDSITIRSGYSANAEIVLARASKVLAVPESTVEFKNDSTFIYVLTDSVPSQKFSRRAVITGMSDGIQIEIKNGLNVNEKVRGAEKK